jgi:hypothetical protein
VDLTRKPSAIAFNAAEEVRALNHRTLNAKAFAYPGDVSDTANAISTLLERLPQTLDQMEAGLIVLQDDNAIRLDTKPLGDTSRQDIFNEVFSVTSALSETRRLIRQAHAALGDATSGLSHMGGLFDDEEDGKS